MGLAVRGERAAVEIGRRRVGTLTAAFDEQHPLAAAREFPGQRDPRRPRADDAKIGVTQGVRPRLLEFNDHFRARQIFPLPIA